jgi:sarcosine oxidase subunit delta
MAFLISCPNCGPRPVTEFRYGGERRVSPQTSDHREWAHYLYARSNKLGVQSEWWYHRLGCQRWFLAQRHTLTNEVLDTHWLDETDSEDADPR